jgi:hypothetical protein
VGSRRWLIERHLGDPFVLEAKQHVDKNRAHPSRTKINRLEALLINFNFNESVKKYVPNKALNSLFTSHTILLLGYEFEVWWTTQI